MGGFAQGQPTCAGYGGSAISSSVTLAALLDLMIEEMLLPDVNILVHAYREAAPGHSRFREWLTMDGDYARFRGLR